MKLRSNFITQDIDGVQFLIPMGEGTFNGVLKSNESAAFVVNMLKHETTLEAIVDAMEAEYDAPRAMLERDASSVIEKLRSVGALEE